MNWSQGLRPLLLAAFAMLPLARNAQAQDYPSKPLRMVVAFAPGGPTDAMARLIADKLGDKLGQRVIVENRPGAGGNIGYESVAKSPADGWGVAAPGGLPAEMTQKLNAAIRDALADADLRDKLAKLNVDPTPSSPVEFEALIKLETKKWADVIKRARITVD
jgi:tripartite-type tricarboxylate transporter receptor subunit TctC